jgi:hypothetical protein
MPPSKRRRVSLEDVVRVIFAELDPVCLKSMCDEDEETRDRMIKIIHLLYLIKTWP